MVKNLPAMPGFNPWVWKITWRREWLPTPVFLPEEFHGQRSLAGYSRWCHKALDTTEQLERLTHIHKESLLSWGRETIKKKNKMWCLCWGENKIKKGLWSSCDRMTSSWEDFVVTKEIGSAAIWRKNTPGKTNSKCKVPAHHHIPGNLKKCEKIYVAGALEERSGTWS